MTAAGPFLVKRVRRIVREPHDMDGRNERVLSVKAVADLDKLRFHVTHDGLPLALEADNYDELREQYETLRLADSLPDGWKLGPFADGSEIHVEATTRDELRSLIEALCAERGKRPSDFIDWDDSSLDPEIKLFNAFHDEPGVVSQEKDGERL